MTVESKSHQSLSISQISGDYMLLVEVKLSPSIIIKEKQCVRLCADKWWHMFPWTSCYTHALCFSFSRFLFVFLLFFFVFLFTKQIASAAQPPPSGLSLKSETGEALQQTVAEEERTCTVKPSLDKNRPSPPPHSLRPLFVFSKHLITAHQTHTGQIQLLYVQRVPVHINDVGGPGPCS